jgi:hypothetical protein
MMSVKAGIAVLVIVLGFAGFLVHRLSDSNPALLMDILKVVSSLVGGYGLGVATGPFWHRKFRKGEDA